MTRSPHDTVAAAEEASSSAAALSRALPGRAAGLPLRARSADGRGPVELVRVLAGEVQSAPWFPAWQSWVAALSARLTALEEAHRTVVTPGSLSGTATTAAVTAEGWTHLEHGRTASAARLADRLLERVEDTVRCYTTDLAADEGRLTELQDLPGETHHGGRRTMRVRTDGGRSWAFKTRPVQGEQLFLAPDGLFAALAGLGPDLHLPSLTMVAASDGRHLWQEWVPEPPQDQLCPGPVVATMVPPGRGGRVWRSVGCLVAAAALFGIEDLGEENVCTRRVGDRVDLVPIDLEVFLVPGRGVARTALVSSPDSPAHHCGIEKDALPCTSAGPTTVLDGVRTVPLVRPPRRRRSRSLLLDQDGRAGYARDLPALLRGAADTWVTACRHRDLLHEELSRRPAARRRRMLPRPTADYVTVLTSRLLGTDDRLAEALPEARPDELEQLDRGDVPYAVTDVGPETLDAWRSSLTLSGLGPVVRDLVEYVREQLVAPAVADPGTPECVAAAVFADGTGCAGLPLGGTDHRVTFTWDASTVRLQVDHPAREAGEPRRPDVADRLVRLDAADAVLRHRWAAGGFTDTEVERRLSRLVQAAAAWFATLLDEVGWPDQELVGEPAHAAAARLVEHLADHPGLQDRAARELTTAAVRGRAPWRWVAGVEDARCVRDGRPQPFGTKFERVNGQLRPCRLADIATVDQRRRAVGLEPLAQYSARVEAWVIRAESRSSARSEGHGEGRDD